MSKHQPVLLQEAIELLQIKPDGIYVDCTLGRGGHAAAILKQLDRGRLYAFDQDPTAIEEGGQHLATISSQFHIINANFKDIALQLGLQNVLQVDGILYDLGVSSPQFDIATRGFSYRFDGPLDMRMDHHRNPLTAHTIVNQYTQSQLQELLWKYAEEKYALQIAQKIIKSRPINTTFELVQVIKSALPAKVLKLPKHPAKKTFQALRIAVNDEFNTLTSSLTQSLALLKPLARVVVITFHSLEEKIVKELFKQHTLDEQQYFLHTLPYPIQSTKQFRLVIKKPIKPSTEELAHNRRSHSAKLWVIEKINQGGSHVK